MNTTEAKASWEEQKEKLKKKISVLNDGKLLIEKEYNDEMLEKIQLKLGITRKELLKIIEKI